MMARSLRDEVHATLTVFEQDVKDLFSSMFREAALEARSSKPDTPASLAKIQSLADRHAELVQLTHVIAQHQENQSRIMPLVAEIKSRDAQQRATIARLTVLRDKLRALREAGATEAQALERGEAAPLIAQDVLDYAQRLAKYTSAPPGYQLSDLQAGAVQPSKAAQADYNPDATRAAAYYDPMIPSMPQELPFPTDRIMRQGILYADAAMESGVGAAEQGGEIAASGAPAPGEMPETTIPTHGALPVLDSFGTDDEDAFDLDLNP
ncbi:unnamed protein product [Malassezia sympodialis ATCC 42132]|nr:uncharacterized protein MSY001_1310 [Malassezia sympodialis ATCC 42132]CCU98604.1 unnamed protein product [Malassezia sympodialis ATCC 42132]|eukprot:XP_018739901.1 uncharacterized protein MSY001_1310 [Malassezia sympodialis ATCC 42132]